MQWIKNIFTLVPNDLAKFTVDCNSLSSVIIPNHVTQIGNDTFRGCNSLTCVTIGKNVISIGDGAFWGCCNLKSITIPNSVTKIGEYAFLDCDGLLSAIIPNSVSVIGESAFENCTSLKTIYCKSIIPPIGGTNMFSFWDSGDKSIGRKIYVPRDSVEAYKSAEYWKEYAEDIVGYDF